MNDADLSKRLYRALLSVVLDDELSAEDLRRVADILARGHLSEAVREAIDAITGNNGQSSKKDTGKERKNLTKSSQSSDSRKKSDQFLSPTAMFDLVKRRKISKAQLLTIIDDIDEQALPSNPDDMTVREIVETFYLNSEPDDQNLLRKIVSGDFSGDPFLQGMSKR